MFVRREAIEQLRSALVEEMNHEVEHLKAIGGPTGMRNGQASALGLARNGVRSEVITRLTCILEEE
jgi:hypothetical protein